jgi:hypothetical protein
MKWPRLNSVNVTMNSFAYNPGRADNRWNEIRVLRNYRADWRGWNGRGISSSRHEIEA